MTLVDVLTRLLETDYGLKAIRTERYRQDLKWGQQDHPMVPEAPGFAPEYEHLAKMWKQENTYRASKGQLAFDGLLLEELYEALSAKDPEDAERELIQLAGLALAAWEASRRRRGVAEETREYVKRTIVAPRRLMLLPNDEVEIGISVPIGAEVVDEGDAR